MFASVRFAILPLSRILFCFSNRICASRGFNLIGGDFGLGVRFRNRIHNSSHGLYSQPFGWPFVSLLGDDLDE